MIFVVYSDVHSNLEALSNFFNVLKDVNYDKLVCLGDLVGYGPDPNSVVELIREKSDIVLGGNHDFGVVGKTSLANFNPYALSACIWTREKLYQGNWKYLDSLRAKKVVNGITWVHSSPFQPEEWHYVLPNSYEHNFFKHLDTQVCFVGHSHLPVILERTPKLEIKTHTPASFFLKPNHKYIINVGSIGQPRDGNPEPVFVVYDSKVSRIDFKRFSYKFTATQKKILIEGLPPYLADRLSQGL